MKYIRTSIIGSSIMAVLFLVAPYVYAIDASNIELLTVTPFSSGDVQIFAKVTIGSDTSVDTWFEYGSRLENLDTKTPTETWERGLHFWQATITGLPANTTYYYRAAIRVDGMVYKTATFDFKTLFEFAGVGENALENEPAVETNTPTFDFKNPFDYFKRNRNTTPESQDDTTTPTESEPVVYTDDPVGGIVHTDSVYYTNDDSEVIEYSDAYRNQFKQQKSSGNRGWMIFLLLLGSIVIIVLLRKMRRRRLPVSGSRRARIERLHQYRYPHQTAHESVPENLPIGNPTGYPDNNLEPDHVVMAEPGNPVVSNPPHQPAVQRSTPTGTFFKTPPR